MANGPKIAVYDSQSREYHRAFQIFLDHTDQKLQAQKWLTARFEPGLKAMFAQTVGCTETRILGLGMGLKLSPDRQAIDLKWWSQ